MSKRVAIYEAENGRIEVALAEETVWLSLQQLADLFERDKSNISRHIKNIFKNKELERGSVVAKNATTAADGKTYQVDYYNLDMVISVGYRVNSKSATHFRQWATERLREHLVQGYTINEQRLKQQQSQVKELEKTLKLFQKAQAEALTQPEATGLLSILTDYTQSFILLNQYDTGNFPEGGLNTDITHEIDHEEAMEAISGLKVTLIEKQEATELFGNPKDDSFAGILGNIVQSFGGDYLYASVEEQAAHLLYFIIKNHPFSDGNKRIGAFMFIWFLQRNKHHLKSGGDVKINDNALVALALLVAQSDPAQKEIMIQLVVNLVKDGR